MYAAVMDACLAAFGGSINFWTLLVDQHLRLDDRVARPDPRWRHRGVVGRHVGRARRGRHLERGRGRGGAREPARGQLHPRRPGLVGHQRPPPRRLPLTRRRLGAYRAARVGSGGQATSAQSTRSGGASSAQCEVGHRRRPRRTRGAGGGSSPRRAPAGHERDARDEHREVEAVGEVDRVAEVGVADPGERRQHRDRDEPGGARRRRCSPPTRRPAYCSGAAPSTVAVSGATVSESPQPNTMTAGSTSAQ